MQAANDVTLAAYRRVHAHLDAGMQPADLAALVNEATTELGARPEFALVLLNESSAYPHGTDAPQTLREGSVILMDCGCSVHGCPVGTFHAPGCSAKRRRNSARSGTA